MDIRATTLGDVDGVVEIDGAVEATRYLHVERTGEGMALSWKIEERPLRAKVIEANRLGDEELFTLKQIASGADEGLALVAEHEGEIIAQLLARVEPVNGTLRVLDVRVDYDFRRQGLGLAMLFASIQRARELGLRAVMAQSRTNNLPAAQLLVKAGFELGGLDTRLSSNHDLVKETVGLFWYAALD